MEDEKVVLNEFEMQLSLLIDENLFDKEYTYEMECPNFTMYNRLNP
jgi:hypothetical protein